MVMSNIVPALVDTRGQPLRRDVLTQEIAGPSLSGVRSIWTGHPENGLTPQRLAALLLSAEQGDAIAYLELAEAMEEKDLHYLSVLGTRKRAVAQLPLTVDAASDDPIDEAAAQLLRDWLDRDTLEAELFDMLDAVGKGFSQIEIIWARGARWLPAKLKWRDPRFFEHDRVDGETVMLRTAEGPQPLPRAKFISHVHPAKSGIPIRGGLARPVAWWYMFRNYSVKDWITFADAYGMPLRLGRYENGTSEADIRKLMRAIAQLGSDAAAAFPKSMEIDFKDGRSGDTGELFQRLNTYGDQLISKAVVGQTSSADATAGGLGSGQANEHGEVRGDIKRADAKLVATTLNRDLVPWIVYFNFGPRPVYPRIKVGKPEEEDIDAYLKVVDAAVRHGVPVGVATFRKATGLAEPKPGEELLGAKPAETPQEPAQRHAGPSGPEKDPAGLLGLLKTRLSGNREASDTAARDDRPSTDPIERAADEAIGDWEPMFDAILSPVEEALATASSFDDARAKLLDVIDRMDVADVRELLARASFGARIAGLIEQPEA